MVLKEIRAFFEGVGRRRRLARRQRPEAQKAEFSALQSRTFSTREERFGTALHMEAIGHISAQQVETLRKELYPEDRQ